MDDDIFVVPRTDEIPLLLLRSEVDNHLDDDNDDDDAWKQR